MDDLEIKELREKYPELFDSDDDEALLKLMQLILVKKGFKFIKNNFDGNNMNPSKLPINPDMKEAFLNHSKEKFEEFQQLPPEEKREKIQKLQEARNERFGWGRNFFLNFKNGFNREINIDPGRLLGLTDGIFGMVITLLAFGIALPELIILNEAGFVNYIYSLVPNIGVVLVSFIFVSSFWIYHHEFLNIKTLNLPFLWLHIFFLACITFIPFTTTVIGNYSQFFLAEVMFGINVVLTIFSFLLLYRYATSHDFLEVKPSLEDIRYTYTTFFIIMFLTILVNLGDFLISPNFIYLFLLIPVISTVRYILKN